MGSTNVGAFGGAALATPAVVNTKNAATGAGESLTGRTVQNAPRGYAPAVQTLARAGTRVERLASSDAPWVYALAGVLFAAVAFLARLGSITDPLDRDEGVYLYVGHTIVSGGMPYTDAADNKGPVTFLLFAGIDLVAGQSATVVRLLLLVFAALAALAVAIYVAHFAGRRAGLVAGLIFAALSVTLDGDQPNTERWGACLMAGAWACSATGGVRAAVGAGALSAAAAGMNVGFLAIFPIVFFEMWRADAPTGLGRRALAFALGGAVVAVPIFVWITAGGALTALAEQAGGQAYQGTSGASFADRLAPSHLLDFQGRVLFAAGVLGSLVALRHPRLRAPAIGALLFIIVMWACVQLSGDDTETRLYYLAVPGIAVGIAVGCLALWATRAPVLRVAAVAAVAGLVVAHAVVPQVRDIGEEPWPDDPDLELAYPAARFIKAHTEPDDPIFVAGSLGQLYWLADRRAPTRFFHVFPLRWRPEYEEERNRELFANPPVALAFLPGAGQRDNQYHIVPELLERFPYRLAYDVDEARIWLLRQE